VGSAAVQLARVMGASPVLAATSSPARLGQPAAVSAVVDLSQGNLRDSIRDQVSALTKGDGVDVVIDTVGGDAFDGAIRALRWRGRLVIVGFASTRIPTVTANYLLLKNIEVSGLQISDYRKRAPELLRQAFSEIFWWCEERSIRPASAQLFALSEWREALGLLDTGHAEGRVVLVPN
jgi:NADPH:quinone reductase